MILNGKKLKNTLYHDSRGRHGESGQLHIAESRNGKKYLVKSNPADVTNEYVAHKVAMLIGVPTSDAVLIQTGDLVEVGIAFEPDFKRANLDDFIGDTNYPDDSPFLADVMAYFALRDLIVLDDNPQIAFAGGRLISFDYADSFYLSDPVLSTMEITHDISLPVHVFKNHLMLFHHYRSVRQVLQRPDTDFLFDAYFNPILNFQDAGNNLQPILDELREVFPPVVPAFYEACFEETRKAIKELYK